MTEDEWQAKVIDTAVWLQWTWCHIPTVQLVDGRYVTTYEGDGGLPDLILARRGVVLLRELKTDRGRPSKKQMKWLDNGAKIWRPRDWDSVVLPELRGAA